jgi:hypothetical protein
MYTEYRPKAYSPKFCESIRAKGKDLLSNTWQQYINNKEVKVLSIGNYEAYVEGNWQENILIHTAELCIFWQEFM